MATPEFAALSGLPPPTPAAPWPPLRAARALWRIAATWLHVLHGVAIVALCWRALDAAGRQARIAWWARGLLRRMGLGLVVQGVLPQGAVLVVANHVSWLDILAVHAVLPQARFVAKSDLQRWPLLGWLIGAVGTLFIERERKRDAVRVVHRTAEALADGQTVAVFPEGTTGTGPQVLPFHANLLQAAISVSVPIQPLALRYAEPGQAFSTRAAWVGDDTLPGSLWTIGYGHGLQVSVALLATVDTRDADRRALARHLHRVISTALADGVAADGAAPPR